MYHLATLISLLLFLSFNCHQPINCLLYSVLETQFYLLSGTIKVGFSLSLNYLEIIDGIQIKINLDSLVLLSIIWLTD